MTKPNPEPDRHVAARLRDALKSSDALNCDDAQALLPDLVAAEQAGVDVDSDPAYTALLRHIDECDDCLALYEELSEAIAALDPASEQPPVPSVPLPARMPTFFGQPSKPRPVARLLEGLRRRFALDIPLPQPLPLVGTLGGTTEMAVFDETLAEVPGSPRLTATVEGRSNGVTLRVTLPIEKPATRWRVELRVDGFAAEAQTDAHGIAMFTAVPLATLHQLELLCEETTS